MSNYPNSIYSGRVMTNRDGVSFDSAKTKVIFAEDFNDKKVEITAIENELGVNAKGSYANVKAWLTALSSSISLLAPYPVGSIYISVASTSPATLFGGTWVAFGAGRVLVGINSGDADFDTVEETRGEKTHTLTAAEQASMPVKLNDFLNINTNGSFGGYDVQPASVNHGTFRVNAIGGGGSHNNIQPSIVVYMWKRTA